MAAHLSALIAFAGVPFGHIVGPLVVYLVQANQSEFARAHARASLNYQLTLSIIGLLAVIVALSAVASRVAFVMAVWWIVIGVGLFALFVASIVFIIQGTIAASEGRPYTYPFAIRFLR
jgi:uncharacterized protein